MNETRTTDYALNELQADEREKFESDLAVDQRLQNDLLASSRVADGLAQIMSDPGEGLEPQTREKLLRAIVENQQALRQRRKIVRFAVPITLAAAASIAVLLLIVGGKTTQGSAVAANGAVSSERSGGFTAQINSGNQTLMFEGIQILPTRYGNVIGYRGRGSGKAEAARGDHLKSDASDRSKVDYAIQSSPQIVQRIGLKPAPTRNVQTREIAGASEATIPLNSSGIRVRTLLWPSPETVGLGAGHHDGNKELLAP